MDRCMCVYIYIYVCKHAAGRGGQPPRAGRRAARGGSLGWKGRELQQVRLLSSGRGLTTNGV